MSENLAYQQAMVLIDRAYRNQMRGELGTAIELYEKSLDLHPTAEAYTYLAWAYSAMGRYTEAVEQCEQAIAVDPNFGNPYNDMGGYLIELGRPEEAIEWLERALTAERYDTPHYALMNLGRIYQQQGQYATALKMYDQALEIDPLYRSALHARYILVGRMN